MRGLVICSIAPLSSADCHRIDRRLQKLAAELPATRDQLFTDAHALGRRGLIDRGRVEKLRTP